MDLFITQLGTLIRTTDIPHDILVKVKKQLTVRYVKRMGKKNFEHISELFAELTDNEWLAVARFCGIKNILRKHIPKLDCNYVNKLNPGNDVNLELSPNVKLYQHQTIACDYLLTNVYNEQKVNKGLASCIFIMDTGMGKTFVALYLASIFKKKTLIILPNTVGFKDWLDCLKFCLPDVKIGQYYGKVKTSGDIILTTITSALSDNFKLNGQIIPQYDFFKEFGFVIFDEVHDFASLERQKIFWRINGLYSLGITATPDERADKMDVVYYKHLGPIVRAVDIPEFNVLKTVWSGEVNVIKYAGPEEYTIRYTNSENWTDTGKMNKQLAEDPYRNNLIIKQITKLYECNMNVYVFAEHRDFLTKLQNYLKLADISLIEESDDIKTFMGGASPEDKARCENEAKIILTTYSYSKQSLSIKKMNAIIFATPRRNKMRQITGRITREGGNTEITRIIVDIVDIKTPLKKQFSDRKKVYLEKKYNLQTQNINYSEVPLLLNLPENEPKLT